MSDFGFKAMAFTFKIRDFFRPRRHIVQEAGIKEGFHVLDYGCGPGSYVKAVAELVGKSVEKRVKNIQFCEIKIVQYK